MVKKDYYEILGIAREASPEEVKKAYRQLALKHHPDRNPGDQEAEGRFKEAAEAYSVLIDPEKRSVYDRFGHDGLRGEGYSGFPGFDSSVFEDFEDILGNFFGFNFGDFFGDRTRQRQGRPQRGRDLALEVEVSLEEAASGAQKSITIHRAETCPACGGSKAQPGAGKEVCPTCRGKGQLRYQQGFFTVSRTCSRCGGRGEVISAPCKSCQGAGRIKQKRMLTLRVPAGVDNGSRLRVPGEGEAGDEGMSPGDLYVVTRVAPHAFFEREGSDLYCKIGISFSQAALGARVEIPTFEGNEVLKVPPGVQAGEVIRLRGKGLREVGSHRKGDLFVKVDVRTPDNLSKEQKALFQRLAELRGENVEEVDRTFADRVRNRVH